MVFSSVPVYLDPPNWQQQHPINHDHHELQHQQSGGRASITDHHHHNQNPNLPPPQDQQQLPPPPGGSIKPGSMAERARQAKIPQPETAMKCPRCDSPNTKFCYFNNYSLTQPRHFCKTCRRYWTRGGALRSVPVGGGCRRNKRTKGSAKSKPSASSAVAAAPPNPEVHQAGAACSNTTSNSGDMFGHLPPPPQHFPFLPNLHHLSSEHYYGAGSGEIGMNNFAGIPMPTQGSSGGGGDVEFLPTGLAEQWRLQQQVHHQFPFFGNLDQTTQTGSILYPNMDTQSEPPSYIRSNHHKALDSLAVTSGLVSQMSAVKFEGNSSNGDDNNNNNNNNQGVNLSRNFLGILGNNSSLDPHHNYSNAWPDVSSFSTSSTSHNII